jgi:uncharacterized protein
MRIVRVAGVPLVGLLLLLSAGVAAADPAARPTAYPKPGICVDPAAALGSGTCARVTRVLRADAAASGDEIAVAVVTTTGGVPIETWGSGLFTAWGLGNRDKGNGVLLVVAVADHRLRIVTGRGLARRLPEGAASELVGATLTPLLRAGRTSDAVLSGLDGIRRALGHAVTGSTALAVAGAAPAGQAPPSEVELPNPTPEPSPPAGGWLLLLGFLGIVGLVVVGAYSRYMKSAHGAEYAELPDAERPWWAREGRRSGWATQGALWSSSEHYPERNSGGSGGSSRPGGSPSSGGAGGGDFGGGPSSGGGPSGSR